MRRKQKHTRKKKHRTLPLSRLQLNSLQTQINNFCITDCILSPLTSNQPSQTQPIPINTKIIRQQATRTIQKHWRAYKLRCILNNYVIEEQSEVMDNETFIEERAVQPQTEPGCQKKYKIGSTAEPYLLSAGGVAAQHQTRNNIQPIVNANGRRWVTFLQSISKKSILHTSKSAESLLKILAVKAYENMNGKNISTHEALNHLELSEISTYAAIKIKLQELNEDPFSYQLQKVKAKVDRVQSSLTRKLQRLTRQSLSCGRLQIYASCLEYQEDLQQRNEKAVEQNDSDHLTLFSEDTPRMFSSNQKEYDKLDQLITQTLIEEAVAEIYTSVSLLEGITPHLKVIKIPFTKLNNKDILAMLNTLPPRYQRNKDIYQLQDKAEQISAPFIKIDVPVVQEQPFPLSFIHPRLLYETIQARQTIIDTRREQLLVFLKDLQKMYFQAVLDAVIQQTESRTLNSRMPKRGIDELTGRMFKISVKEVGGFLRLQKLFGQGKDEGEGVSISDYLEEQTQFCQPNQTIEFILQTLSQTLLKDLINQLPPQLNH